MLDAGCIPNHVTDTTLDFLGKEIEKQRYERASIIRDKDGDSWQAFLLGVLYKL